MFLEPSINDLEFSKDISNLNWIKTIEILRSSFLNIHPSVLEEAKKHFPEISSVEEKLILNGGRGVLKTEDTKKLFKYAKLADKRTIFILTTFNKCSEWALLAKKILNISQKDININFGADPKCEHGIYSRRPELGYRVYITDLNGLNRLVSADFFSGKMFGNKIDLMIVDKFFQMLLMIPQSLTKEIYSMVFVDDVYISQNFDSLHCFDLIAWTTEQQFAVKEIDKLFTVSSNRRNNPAIMEILKEVDFLIE